MTSSQKEMMCSAKNSLCKVLDECKDISLCEKFDMQSSICKKDRPVMSFGIKGEWSCKLIKIAAVVITIVIFMCISSSMAKAALCRRLKSKMKSK